MDYEIRLQALGSEYNALAAQLQQPLNRLSFLQGQIEIVMALKAEEDAAKKGIAEALKKASEEAVAKVGSADVAIEMIPGTQASATP